ncbi:MAG: hypothetical protein ACKN92_08315, partial [Candidatus Nanopelagicaceae bacterium]
MLEDDTQCVNRSDVGDRQVEDTTPQLDGPAFRPTTINEEPSGNAEQTLFRHDEANWELVDNTAS